MPYSVAGFARELNATQTAAVPDTVPSPGFRFHDPNHKSFAPRLGLAYRLTDKTVIRAGFGIYYNPNQTNSFTFLTTNPPFGNSTTCTSLPNTPTLSLQNPIGAGCSTSVSQNWITDNWHLPPATMNQWSFGVQRQLSKSTGLDVQYLGSHSLHLDRSYFNNTPYFPGPGAINPRRPNQLFGQIRTISNDLISNYHHLAISLHQRVFHGFQVEASYTWAHALDVTSDSNNGGAPMNPYNWRQDYGNAPFDIRHRFLATYIYAIPVRRNQQPVPQDRIWRMAAQRDHDAAGRNPLQSFDEHRRGQHQFARTAAARSAEEAGIQLRRRTPDRVHRQIGIRRPRQHRSRHFRLRQCGPEHPARTAHVQHGHVAVQEFSRLKERMRFTFRAEAFNVWNNPEFSNPNANIEAATFGNITCTSVGAQGVPTRRETVVLSGITGGYTPCTFQSTRPFYRCSPSESANFRRATMDLRAQVGWLSHAGLSRRRRNPDPEPRRKTAQPLLSRAVRAAAVAAPERCVLDGEIVIAKNDGLDFDALQLRLHPAASRVKLLSQRSRHRSSSSTCSARETAICAASRSRSRAASWSRCSRPRRRRST